MPVKCCSFFIIIFPLSLNIFPISQPVERISLSEGHYNLYCIKFPLCTNPKSVYNLTPISDAVICIVPHPYSFASSITRDSNSFAIPLLRYAGSVNILDSNPILPLGHPKYGGLSTNYIPLVAMMLSPSTAIQDAKVPSAI